MIQNIILFSAIFIGLVAIAVNLIYNPPLATDQEIFEKVVNAKEYDEEYYRSLDHEELLIPSENGYNVHAILYKNNSNRFVVYTHGVRWNHMGGYKFMELYYSLCGFNVLIYDCRRHGKTGGKDITWGYYEKYDVKACVNYLYDTYGDDIIIGVHGESVGASATIEYLGIEDQKPIRFIIEEGGFSDINKLFSKVIKQVLKTRGKIILFIANILSKLKKGYYFSDISPEKVISKIETPMLFIHGDADDLVPLSMAVDLYNKKKEGYKELYVVKGGKHSKSYYADAKGFMCTIIKFLINIKILNQDFEHYDFLHNEIMAYNQVVEEEEKSKLNDRKINSKSKTIKK